MFDYLFLANNRSLLSIVIGKDIVIDSLKCDLILFLCTIVVFAFVVTGVVVDAVAVVVIVVIIVEGVVIVNW